MNNFEVSIINNQDKFSIDTENIESIIVKMLDYITKSADIIEISVLKELNLAEIKLNIDMVFVNDEQIKEINTSYRNKPKATDVISFALFADDPDLNFIMDNEIPLGEIIISLDTAQRQALENNKTLEEEIDFLLSHGVLHLLGIDHPDEQSLEKMLKIQDILVAL